MDRAELERLDRESLVLRAQTAGIKRARVLTRPELLDELVRLDPQVDSSQLKRTRGFFGLARDLLSRVVERGLHLPDAAERFRASLADPPVSIPRPEAQAIPTVTLAEIYAAQGHNQRAIDTLKRVLADEPDHGAARALLEKLEAADFIRPEPELPPEPEIEPSFADEDEDAPVDTPADDDPSAEPAAVHARPASELPPDDDDVAPLDVSPLADSLPAAEIEPLLASFEEILAAEQEIPMSESPPTVALESVADRCVAVPTEDGDLFVWWQLSPAALNLGKISFFFVRVVAIVPTWDGPDVRQRDIAANPGAESLTIGDFPPGAVVRAAVGFMPDGEFVPVAHSPALELGDEGITEWTFGSETHGGPSALEDPVVRSAIERAGHV